MPLAERTLFCLILSAPMVIAHQKELRPGLNNARPLYMEMTGMEGAEINTLFGELRSAAFNSLAALDIRLSFIDTEEDLGAVVYGAKGDSFVIQLSRADITAMSKDALIGCLAHELAHIEKDTEGGSGISELARNFVPSMTANDEREVDRMVIAKGYGRQLLALQTYHDEHYEPYNASDGLTRDEIMALVERRLE
ncbi:MAG TPA: hypothetical protein VFA65_19465 [Bryobacteraceae bacterium]|nr:hypothetical protein [Bryobacteraceae bacterium]